jgi:hypothetical protein
MPGMSLYQKNLVFLESAFPAFAGLARQTTDTVTSPVLDGGGLAVDIDLGAGRLYNRPAREFAREQVASWHARPDRVVVNRPDPETLVDLATQSMCETLSRQAGETLLPVPPADETGLLVVIGVGLGEHIRELVNAVSPRHLVLIEPISEFALHSLHALDWASLVGDCKSRGTTVDLIVDPDPRTIQNALEGLIPVETRFVHRFGVANTLRWLRERRPGGRDPLPGLDDRALDSVWRDTLAREGTADTIYMTFEKPAN